MMRKLCMLYLILGWHTCRPMYAEQPCEQRLSLCEAVIKAGDKQAEDLKQSVKDLEGRLAKAQPGVLQSIPWGVWAVVGIVTGVAVGRGISK